MLLDVDPTPPELVAGVVGIPVPGWSDRLASALKDVGIAEKPSVFQRALLRLLLLPLSMGGTGALEAALKREVGTSKWIGWRRRGLNILTAIGDRDEPLAAGLILIPDLPDVGPRGLALSLSPTDIRLDAVQLTAARKE